MSTLDIGTLSGRIEIIDTSAPTLDGVLDRIKRLDEEFLGFGAHIAESAAGYFTARAAFDAIREGAQLAGEAIADLTTEGAKNESVVQNFNNLTSAAGLLSDELLNDLRKATHGTVDDMTLIKAVSSDLTAGLHLTEQQFTLVGQAAFALAKATGKDEKEALETVNDALLTGRTRGLAYLTGKIDLVGAEQKYAASLGVTTSQLSTEGKLEADRQAIFDALGGAVGRVGAQTENLNDFIQQGRTWWANFTDELGRSVATSPKVLQAFNEIKKTLVDTFGVDEQELISTITDYIGDFALKVAAGFQDVVNWAKEAKETFDKYYPLFETAAVMVGTYVTAITLAEVKTIAFETAAVAGTAAAKGLELAMGAWEALDFASIAGAATSLELLGTAATAALGPIGLITAAVGLAFGAYKAFSSGADSARISTEDLKKSVADFHKEVMSATDGLDEDKAAANALAVVMKDLDHSEQDLNATHAEQINKLKQTEEEVKKYNEAIKAINSVGADYKATVDSMDQALVSEIDTLLRAGISEDKIAAAKKLTVEQVKAVSEVLKQEEAGYKAVIAAEEQMVQAENSLAQTHINLEQHSLVQMQQDELVALGNKYDKGLLSEEQYQKQILNIKTDYAHQAEGLYEEEAQKQVDAVQAGLDKQEAALKDQLDHQKIDEDSYWTAIGELEQGAAAKQQEIWDKYYSARKDRARQTEIDIQNAQQGAVDGTTGHVKLLESAWDAVGEKINDNTAKVKLLDGEIVSVKEAMDRFNAGGSTTYDLTTAKGIAQYKQLNPAASIAWSDDQIIAFAKQGGTLQQLINMGVISPYAGYKQGNIPSFADGGSGDFGTGTLAMLHGKEVITPVDKAGALNGDIYMTWNVNGTGAQVARVASDQFTRTLKQTRFLGGSR